MLRFTRLPAPALDVARRVLEEDPEFRARVAAGTSEDEVGPAGWLWLNRPEGWQAALEALRREDREATVRAHDDREERAASKRLEGAEAAARRAEQTARTRTVEAEQARSLLAAEQAARRESEADRTELAALLATAREERMGAVRRLKEAEAELANRAADLRRAQHRIRMLEAELAHALASPPPEPTIPAMPGDVTVIDPRRLTAALTAAKAAAAELSRALADATALGGAAEEPPPPAAPAGRRDRRASEPVRVPARLPPPLLDDSVEAAAHLVRLRDAVVVVDGYNVSLTAWPDRPLPEQRARLVDALAELHARTGVEVVVVFDGKDPEGPRSLVGRPGVRVRFSPADVEADDVVIALVGEQPAGRTVVVASSDRRVRDGARTGGANVLSARQLLGALRR